MVFKIMILIIKSYIKLQEFNHISTNPCHDYSSNYRDTLILHNIELCHFLSPLPYFQLGIKTYYAIKRQ